MARSNIERMAAKQYARASWFKVSAAAVLHWVLRLVYICTKLAKYAVAEKSFTVSYYMHI